MSSPGAAGLADSVTPTCLVTPDPTAGIYFKDENSSFTDFYEYWLGFSVQTGYIILFIYLFIYLFILQCWGLNPEYCAC
jgi:hypothetical protein